MKTPLSDKAYRRLTLCRLALPPLTALFVLISGFFHTVYALEGREALWVSPWRLGTETLKTGRRYFLLAGRSNGESLLYGFLMTGAILALLTLLAAAGFAFFSSWQGYLVNTQTEPEAMKAEKIRFGVLFRTRLSYYLSLLLLLVPTLYCEYFSLVGRFFSGARHTFSVRFNLPFLMAALLVAATVLLDRLTLSEQQKRGKDMFSFKEPEESP